MIKYSKIEFGIATVFFILFVVVAARSGSDAYRQSGWNHTTGTHGLFDFVFAKVQMVIVTYGGLLALNYYIVPKFAFQKKYLETVGLVIALVGIAGLSYTVFFSYADSLQYRSHTLSDANSFFASKGFALAFVFLGFYTAYVLFRELVIYQYGMLVNEQNLQKRIIREITLVVSVWLAMAIPIYILRHTGIVRHFPLFYFVTILPACFCIYFINLYWLIPSYKKNSQNKLPIYVLSLLGLTLAIGLAEAVFFRPYYVWAAWFPVSSFLFTTLVSIILSWWVYLTNDTYRQLTTLKTALGTSNANLQYLRSQINPHFLFNTLNTLYGTALMENSHKTGEGIQKLGDMMRFMLHENNQDRIALSRELEYLHNYIDLQNMRLALSPEMVIDIQIEDIVGYYEIAPMLLIPFIENAYKHGISLQERSWISVSLYKNGDTLHLDVHNSIHQANANDPERFHSGTGLDNVKQRLQLLYPQRHELVVRQNVKEFFIHLTLTLNTQA